MPNTLQHLSMSTSGENMNLSDLPSDVMRIIMKMEPDAIDSMRMISPSWNQLYLEKGTLRQFKGSLPVLRLFQWSIFPQGNAELHIQLQQKDVDYLGVDWGNRNHNPLDPESRDVLRAFRDTSRIENRVALLLNRCSRIDHLKLAMDIYAFELPLKIARDAMRHLTVGTLTLSGLQRIDQPIANIILDIIRNRNNSLKCLAMRVFDDCNILMENFDVIQPLLAEASTLIPRVYFSFTEKKVRYDRSHWERIHNNLRMKNSKIIFFESYRTRSVEIRADN